MSQNAAVCFLWTAAVLALFFPSLSRPGLREARPSVRRGVRREVRRHLPCLLHVFDDLRQLRFLFWFQLDEGIDALVRNKVEDEVAEHVDAMHRAAEDDGPNPFDNQFHTLHCADEIGVLLRVVVLAKGEQTS